MKKGKWFSEEALKISEKKKRKNEIEIEEKQL